jgi:hypothetical protein
LKKKIYFIVKNVTEFDHIIPLINSLEEKNFDIFLDFFNPKLNNFFLENKFQILINPNVKIGYFHLTDNSPINKFFLNYFLNYFLNKKNSNINFSTLKKNLSFKNLIISIVKKLILSDNFINKILFNKKWIFNKLNDLSPNYLFIDNSFEKNNIYRNLSEVAANLNIVVFEYPHSLYLGKRRRKNSDKFNQNKVLFNSIYEKNVSINKNFLNDYFIYGSFKYDFDWQKKINNSFKNKKSTKLNIVYVMTDFQELDKEKELNSIKFLTTFKNLNITIIPPSRDNFDNQIKELKFFFGTNCNIDNNYALSTFSSFTDVYITSISGGVMDGICNFKKIICLKYLCDPKIRQLTFFNYDPFYTFETFEDLKKNFEKCLSYKLSLSDKKKYIKYMRKYVVPFGRRNIINNFIKSKLT